jgi:hypothetical protein
MAMSESRTTPEPNYQTVSELVALIERTKQSLSEVGRTDLASVCHVAITADGEMRLRFEDISEKVLDSTVLKAISLDPIYEHDD